MVTEGPWGFGVRNLGSTLVGSLVRQSASQPGQPRFRGILKLLRPNFTVPRSRPARSLKHTKSPPPSVTPVPWYCTSLIHAKETIKIVLGTVVLPCLLLLSHGRQPIINRHKIDVQSTVCRSALQNLRSFDVSASLLTIANPHTSCNTVWMCEKLFDFLVAMLAMPTPS